MLYVEQYKEGENIIGLTFVFQYTLITSKKHSSHWKIE